MENKIELSEIKYSMTWQKAMRYAKKLGEGWYLPDVNELRTMYWAKELGHSDFAGMKGYFWASTRLMGFAKYYAEGVDFDDGCTYSDNKSYSNSAIYVRIETIETLMHWIIQRRKNARAI